MFSQHTLSIPPFHGRSILLRYDTHHTLQHTTPCNTLSTHPMNVLSTHPLNTPLNTPYQHTLSTHPLNTPFLPLPSLLRSWQMFLKTLSLPKKRFSVPSCAYSKSRTTATVRPFEWRTTASLLCRRVRFQVCAWRRTCVISVVYTSRYRSIVHRRPSSTHPIIHTTLTHTLTYTLIHTASYSPLIHTLTLSSILTLSHPLI